MLLTWYVFLNRGLLFPSHSLQWSSTPKVREIHQHEATWFSLLPFLIWIEAAQSPHRQERSTEHIQEPRATQAELHRAGGAREAHPGGQQQQAAPPGSNVSTSTQVAPPAHPQQLQCPWELIGARAVKDQGPRSLSTGTSFPHAERALISWQDRYETKKSYLRVRSEWGFKSLTPITSVTRSSAWAAEHLQIPGLLESKFYFLLSYCSQT